MTPFKKYQADLEQANFKADPSQKIAMQALDNLYHQLMQGQTSRLYNFLRKTEFIKGIYLWGNVGAGKTYLMDTFYKCLKINAKVRHHFHEFMSDVHQQLTQLQGASDPLKQLAKQLRKKTQIICFDEFFVTDIVDAMLLNRLFGALFAEGITLVATSNVRVDDLYKDGLQRERFLPLIALLKQRLYVFQVGNNRDYRLEHSQSANVYFFPLNTANACQMEHSFLQYSGHSPRYDTALQVNKRSLQPRAYSTGVVWFDFAELCEKPCNAADYLSITRQFHTVLLSNLPDFKHLNSKAVTRFINLIDVFYDEQIHLLISAATDVEMLAKNQQTITEFSRTVSRLYEMRSASYLEKTIAKKYAHLEKL